MVVNMVANTFVKMVVNKGVTMCVNIDVNMVENIVNMGVNLDCTGWFRDGLWLYGLILDGILWYVMVLVGIGDDIGWYVMVMVSDDKNRPFFKTEIWAFSPIVLWSHNF